MNELKSELEIVKTICLKLLALREHSRQELVRKLSAKGYAQEFIKPVLDELATERWQSDQRYADSYARQRSQKGFGYTRINYELKQRGISNESVNRFKEELQANECEVLRQLYLKKYSDEPIIDRREWAKRFRFLLHRGFSADTINTLLRELQIKFK